MEVQQFQVVTLFQHGIGRYVKVGRQVTIWYRMAGGSGYSGSSALAIQGIPFSNNTAI